MPEMIFYVLKNGEWQEYDRVKDRRDYASLVRAATDGREDGAAQVLRLFVLGGVYAAATDFALVCRALRHFDEVGLSNKIFEFIETVMGDCDGVAIAKDRVDNYTAADFSAWQV